MSTEQLVQATAFMFGVDRADLFSTSRVARVAEARQALAWALRCSNWSLGSIGDFLHRDHTTIIYGLKSVERKQARDARFAERLAVLRQALPEPPADLLARVTQLEARVAELEAQLRDWSSR